jgi:para-nitrobenzyl esterase
MLAGADPYDIDTLGRRLHTAWLGFIRTGTPTADTPWPQYAAASPASHHWNA